MAEGAGEEDPFAEFLSQEQHTSAAAAYVDAAEGTAQDANITLRQLLECAQRQEQLLGKVCSLLVCLDEKVGRISNAQERLEASIEQLASRGAEIGAPSAAGSAAQQRPVARGTLMQPPGKTGSAPGTATPAAGASFTGAPAGLPGAEEQRRAAEKLALDRARIEEDGRRREEELARKREEDERRKREEAERSRLAEERRREEERQRKADLEKKTGSLMSNLISGGGGSLFGDDEPKRNSKGGLFDD